MTFSKNESVIASFLHQAAGGLSATNISKRLQEVEDMLSLVDPQNKLLLLNGKKCIVGQLQIAFIKILHLRFNQQKKLNNQLLYQKKRIEKIELVRVKN